MNKSALLFLLLVGLIVLSETTEARTAFFRRRHSFFRRRRSQSRRRQFSHFRRRYSGGIRRYDEITENDAEDFVSQRA
uniref:Uncharacterized protein n=1 Tax=Ciona intestinalis TaxID=7719 RepID=F6W8S2_CIOIN